MLTKIETETGSYLKYTPSREEIIELFKSWKINSVVKPSELPSIIKISLEKWNMINLYPELIKELKLKEGDIK